METSNKRANTDRPILINEQMYVEMNVDTAIVKISGPSKDVGMLITILNTAANAADLSVDYITTKHIDHGNK